VIKKFLNSVSNYLPRFFCALLSSFILFSPRAEAIIDIESTLSGAKKNSVSADVSVNGSSGNSDVVNLSLDGASSWKWGDDNDNTFFILGTYQYGRSGGKANIDRGNIHIRNRHLLIKGLEWELFTQLEKDRFTRKKFRYLAGTGLRTLVWNSDATRIYLGTGFFWELERLSPSPAAFNEPAKATDVRGNFYLGFNNKITDSIDCSLVAYYQPRLKALADYRFLGQSRVRVKIDEQLNLNISVEASSDSRPPYGIKGREYRYSTGLELNF